MAKKKIKPIQFTGNEDYMVTPKSRNLTFEYTGAGNYIFNIETGFTLVTGEIYGYKDQYQNFAFKSGDNLILKTLFTKDSGKAKIVTTIIKNYFADDTKDYTFSYKTYVPNTQTGYSPETKTIKPDTELGTDGLYNPIVTENDGKKSYWSGTTKKDTFEFDDDYSNFVYEAKGNDEYTSQHANKTDRIWDLAGNDKYKIEQDNDSSGILYSTDYSGKDEYTADGTNARLYSKDYAGNDKYYLKNGAEFWVDDYKGNDRYEVNANSNTDEGLDRRINDKRGKDSYYLTNANVCVVDQGGKDYYEISGDGTKVEVTDEGKGNDKYKVKDISGMTYDNLAIADYRGNESYTFTNVKAEYNTFVYRTDSDYTVKDDNGSDKYTFDNSGHIIIKDAKGNDKYTARNGCENIDICDESGKDKYYFTDNDYYSFIFDKKGNDKYKFTSLNDECRWITVHDYAGKDSYTITGKADKHARSNFIYDESTTSKDKYNFTYVDNFYISDKGGNDSYVMKASRGDIYDYGGKDTLTLAGTKKSNIVFMTNYNSNSIGDASCSLIIYNKTNKSYIKINKFYKDDDENGLYDEGCGDGRIETIKAGKTVLKNVPKFDHFNQDTLRTKVDTWLEANHYGNVNTALSDAYSHEDKDISGLIAIFEGKDVV